MRLRKMMPLVLGLAAMAPAANAEPLNLVLNWTAGADHAPIYWAKAQGAYTKAGIDLNIETGKGSMYAAQRAGVGAAQIGIADMPTALQARSKGADLTGVMVIFSNSPYTIYWRKSLGINTAKDLPGHKIGTPPADAAREMWPVIAKVIGIRSDSVSWVNVAPDAKFAALQAGTIDATTQFYYLHHVAENVFGNDMGFLRLSEIGFNPYGNTFFFNSAYAKAHPDIVKAFVKVTQQAYAECLHNPSPCTESVAASTSQDPKVLASSWDLVAELVRTKSTDHPIGWFDPKRMQDDFNLVKEVFGTDDKEPEAAFSNDYLDAAIKQPK
jgi:NitT/TauT family transport system substrate-binding protein